MKITKILCDRCKKEIPERPVYIGFCFKNVATEDLEEPLDGMDLSDPDFCLDCATEIYDFITGMSKAIPASVELQEPVSVRTEDPEEKEDKPKKKASIEPKSKLDQGKLIALYNAGWKPKDIAAELHTTSKTVSQYIYLHNKSKNGESK